MPVFEQIDGLERAILSIIKQHLPAAEVIIVDDGSAPNIAAKIQAITAAYSLRLLRHSVNKGVSQARNSGIMAASGEWIALLDADDYWEADFLQAAWQIAHDYSADLVGTAYRYVHVGGTTTAAKIQPAGAQQEQDEVFRVDDYFQYALAGDLPFSCSSVLFSRNAAMANGLFDSDLRMGEDQVFWQRLIQSGAPSLVLNRVLSNYDISGAESACNSIAKVAAWEFVKKIHHQSFNDASPYRQRFIDKNALKAFVYAMLYRRFDLAKQISQSSLVVSRFKRLLMRTLLLSGSAGARLIAVFYRRLSQR